MRESTADRRDVRRRRRDDLHGPAGGVRGGRARGSAAILGAATATPYASVGAYCRGGPAAIRAGAAPYAANLAHIDFDLGGAVFADGEVTAVDCGDVAIDEDDHAGDRDRIRQAVATLLDRGLVPLVLGGDDSVPIPVLEAYAGRGPLTILQIDAHIDWRDEVQGERLGLSSTMRRASEMAHVGQIIQVGQRAIGSARSATTGRGGGRRPVRAGARPAPPVSAPCWS